MPDALLLQAQIGSTVTCSRSCVLA